MQCTVAAVPYYIILRKRSVMQSTLLYVRSVVDTFQNVQLAAYCPYIPLVTNAPYYCMHSPPRLSAAGSTYFDSVSSNK